MLCPHCRHNDGLHAGPGAQASEPGTCQQSRRVAPGTWAPCPCPGWRYWDAPAPVTTPTMQDLARALNQDAPRFDLPFTLTAEPARTRGHQLGLFEGVAADEEPSH